MKINNILVGEIGIPLKRPFKTSLRQVNEASCIGIKIETDQGLCGYGEAPPTAVITGDTKGSIISAVKNFIKPALLGHELEDFDGVLGKLNSCILKNTSAKAAVDMALYDIKAKSYGVPLYEMLGGAKKEIETDITISLNPVAEMVKDSIEAVKEGYSILKIKVGGDVSSDIERVFEIRKAVGPHIKLRIDANQAWSAKEAVRIITRLEDMGAEMELVEQPVKYNDINGMCYITSRVYTDILADECIFTPADAIMVMEKRAADMINIKLMKTGGIYNALKICAIAEIYGCKCMMGCMLETKLAVSAAAHLACGKNVVAIADLDGPALCEYDPYTGGPIFELSSISMPRTAGIGIEAPDFIRYE